MGGQSKCSACANYFYLVFKNLNKKMLGICFDGLKVIAGILGTSSFLLEKSAILVSTCQCEKADNIAILTGECKLQSSDSC